MMNRILSGSDGTPSQPHQSMLRSVASSELAQNVAARARIRTSEKHADMFARHTFSDPFSRNDAERQLALLVVDSNELILQLMQLVFGTHFTVFTAACGQQALDIMTREDIAVIFTEQHLPDITGVQLLARAKQMRPTTLSILSSIHLDSTTLVDALKLDTVRGFLNKPWKLVELRRWVEEVMQQYQAAERSAS